MRILVLQHVPFEGPAGLLAAADWLGATLEVVRVDQGGLASAPHFDALIALGGPMSVNDGATLPWLEEEKRLIRECVREDKPFLGICLGAQLLASAFGARVYPNAQREIGWFPVHRAAGAKGHPFGRAFPKDTTVFHWHGETFDLPEGATHLLSSDACAHQAFALGPRALGLQFHLETTPEAARQLIRHARGEMTRGPYVQAEEDILQASRFARLPGLLGEVMDAWLSA